MATYQLVSSPIGTLVQREADGVIIPADPGNLDWQTYQAWLAAGNTPDPAAVPTAAAVALTQLEANDGLMFRALEVLIDILLAKNVIAATDVSATIRTLYLARKSLRVAAGVP